MTKSPRAASALRVGWGVLGCWMRVSGLLGMVTGLFMAPYWPRCRSTLAFVDVAAGSEQGEVEKNTKGGYSLQVDSEFEVRMNGEPESEVSIDQIDPEMTRRGVYGFYHVLN